MTRRGVQTVVIGLVILVSTAASTLGLGLIVDSNGTFQHAFAVQHGAHLVVTVDSARAANAQLAATRRLPEVTAAAGPYPEVSATPRASLQGGINLPTATLAGRSSPGGPLDDITWTRAGGLSGPARSCSPATTHSPRRCWATR